MVRENLNAFSITQNNTNKSLLASSSSSFNNIFNFTDLKKILIKLGDKLVYCLSENIHVEITNESNVKLGKKMIKFTLERAGSSIAETIYIPEDTKGKFSPIARRDNISGVHQLKDLISKFKLPISVQLVHPQTLPLSTLNMWNFTG